MIRGERAELQAALTFSNNAEGYLVVYFEVANAFNRNTGHEEVAVDKDIDFTCLTMPVRLVYITYCHASFTDIHNPRNLLMRFLRNSDDQVWNLVALMFSSFSIRRIILHVIPLYYFLSYYN